MHSTFLQQALAAKRESRHIEFKREFDPTSRAQWCEVVKDIVAIGNSGGGIILFGLENNGVPSGVDLTALAKVDPADVGNRITGFTGAVDLEFDIQNLEKEGSFLVAFIIQPVSIPLVFEKAGTYDPQPSGKSSAFAQGTIYFRHGAKSEPARTTDLLNAFHRQLKLERKSWLAGIRKVTAAPSGSRFLALHPSKTGKAAAGLSSTVHSVRNPNATPVYLSRDPKKARGAFVHEQVSEALFDEINNVVDANRIISKGNNHFLLGPPVYYRIYAERQFVKGTELDYVLFLDTAMVELYAPGLYWATKLSPEGIAPTLASLYLSPKRHNIHYLMRLAILCGEDFSRWLLLKWQQKWEHYVQKPTFYSTFSEMVERLGSVSPIVIASRLGATWHKSFPNEKACSIDDLIATPDRAKSLLSSACLTLFTTQCTNASLRSVARDLDYVAHGHEIMKRSAAIVAAFKRKVANKTIGDIHAEDDSVNA